MGEALLTFIITSFSLLLQVFHYYKYFIIIEQLFAKDLFFRMLLGGGFIIVVAHTDSRNLIEDIRDHAFMMSIQKRSGRGLEICCVFVDSIVSKWRSLVKFCGWWRWRE